MLGDLGDSSPYDVAAEQARVEHDGWGARLLALEGADGLWEGGACFPSCYTGGEPGQPWTATMHTLQTLGGLRLCEVLGLRLEDLKTAERRVFIAEGKGEHQRLVPVSARFFATVADYLRHKRPAGCETDRLFVVLKGPNRSRPLSPAGLDEIIRGARRRAGLAHLTCHELWPHLPLPVSNPAST